MWTSSRFCASTACCMATAHETAVDDAEKATMIPSPRFFTSVPSLLATAFLSVAKWARRT